MGALIVASVCVGPLTFACALVVVALVLLGEVSSVVSVGMCVVVVSSAPLVSGCVASVLYRWCFPAARARLVMNAAGLLTVLALLSDGQMLSGLARVATTMPTVNLLVSTLSAATVVGILSAALVMIAVLILEVPARWFVLRENSAQWEGIFHALRLIGTFGVLLIGWGILDEFARARLKEFLLMFS